MNITAPTYMSRPGSTKSSDDLLLQLDTWLKDGENSTPETNWREEASEDYKFYAGQQDEPEVVSLLQAQKRPTTVYNEIKPKVDMLIGMAEQIRKVPDVQPVGKEDEALVEIMNGVFKHFRTTNGLSDKEMECFMHSTKSGRSFLNLYVNFDNPFRPEIKTKRFPGRDCIVDPNSIELDMSDATYFFASKWFKEDMIKAVWPEFDKEIVRMTKGDRQIDTPIYFDESSELYRLVEGWYRKKEPAIWFINPMTGKPDHLRRSEWIEFRNALREGIPLPDGSVLKQELQSIETRIDYMYYALFSGDVILESGETPYNHNEIPFIQYGAYRNEEENRWFSATTMMKDPQVALNTMRRQFSHLLQTSPKGILIHEINAILNIDEYDEHSSEPNFRVEVADGKIEKLKFSDQPQISPVYSQLDAMYLESMKNVSGAQDPLMGIQTSSREPGVTARSRLESSIAVLYILFNGFRKSRIQGGKQLLSLIQQYVDYSTVVRIEGEKGVQLLQINDQMNPQVEGFNDITAGTFDMVIDESAENVTLRQSIAAMLMEFGRNNPGTIPPEVIMDYIDLPFTVKAQVQQANELRMQREYELEMAKINKVKSQ